MSLDKIIKKIPGEVPVSRREGQGFVDDLESKTNIEVRDLLERQDKLLANKSFISRLPDKGEKITRFRAKLLQEINRRNDLEQAANLLSRLNIASEGKDAMNELEWTGKFCEKNSSGKIVELDSDDEEDPLKILAQPTGTGVHKKKIIILPPEETLINEQDLQDIQSFSAEGLDALQHVKYIVDKVEKDESNQKEHFKPYKTTKTNVHDPMKERVRKKDKHWEVTAATPPLIVHGAVKGLSLNESLKLQKEQAEKLREVQARHAIERLTQHLGIYPVGGIPNSSAYRSRTRESDSSDTESDEEHEVHDEEDNDKAGTVVFTIDSMHE
ncbi:DNA-directed RNA polymerase II subunit GRINL1A [Fopius arisanus]|uniref:DNA-directed RNA polymerase II subunit GRINL1A n=1 Tax=Fopius arisanus TaxID=64838 RepID=A0A9R1SZ88_9HYME|nr:PREDICTED: DNA-directed RNA polymerase II subunit GRINL1A [Fopius arisanus]XP_011299987.1 PREDICTED: DNA-directed RNA polymerase II subunit GRINL1A [Fopius arisanus]